MPFRARLNPSTLARRVAAVRPVRPLPGVSGAPSLAATSASASAGPGPRTLELRSNRTYKTSAPAQAFSFFRRKPAPIKPADAVMATLGPGLSDPLAAAYDNLIKWIEYDGNTRRLTGEEMERLMAAISGRRSAAAAELMQRLWNDLALHGLQPEDRYLRQLIYSLARNGKADEALALLLDGHAAAIEAREWIELVRCAAKSGNTDAVLSLAENGIKDERLYAALLNALNGKDGVDSAQLQALLDRMERNGVKPGLWTESALVPIYIMLGDVASAKSMADAWPSVEDEMLRSSLLSAKCEVEIARRDVPAAVEVIRTMAGTDDEVPPRASSFVINAYRASPTVRDTVDAVHRFRGETGVRLSKEGWKRLILGMDVDNALALLEEARLEAAVLDEPLAKALIGQLCDAGRIDDAMGLYDELVIASDADPTNESRQPSMDIFRRLLAACAREGDTDTALSVLAAIKEKGFVLRTPKLGEQLTALIAAAPDHVIALDLYKAFRAVSGRWSAATFSFAISAFVRLRTKSSAVPPPDFVIEMMHDMRKAGYQPGAEILTSVLASYASLAKRIAKLPPTAETEFKRSALLSATRDVRTLTSLDPLIVVDLNLLNTLMNALSCCGASAEALRVWDEILPRLSSEDKRAGEVSVAIVIDACSYGGQFARAKKIWGWATRHGLNSGLGARSAWIECLCRYGKYEDAIAAIKDFSDPPADKDLAAIVLKYGFRSDSPQVVFDALQEAFPDWWPDLSKLIKK
ncbi:hypothetical protein A1Q2_07752 [Trichosporon asahii var. asahii CBS 8904]|uniref:Uncharacterized protein n=1 Tax=Trichosporon asahii var. asahii (strain CBS 8904) TaxID=1220162 RepID=K1VAU8_TRIAC|nr:hypothetical protein A1Q2_07752 [Trichosporon asahii var. asahii CBS 8904]